MRINDSIDEPKYNNVRSKNYILLFCLIFGLVFFKDIHIENGHSLLESFMSALGDGAVASLVSWGIVNVSNITAILFKRESLSNGALDGLFAITASYFILTASAGL